MFTMFTIDTKLYELRLAIVNNPLVVSPDERVINAIAQMMAVQENMAYQSRREQQELAARSSCVLVLEDGQAIGILTERDVIRLTSQQQPLDRLSMREVMSQPIVTVKIGESIRNVHQLMDKSPFHKLVVMGEQNELLGIVTETSLLQSLNSPELIRLEAVALMANQRSALEESNALLVKTSEDLRCTIEELRSSTEELIEKQHHLEDEQVRYHNLFNFSPDGYLVTDVSGKIKEANQVILDQLAISHELIRDKPFIVFVAPDHSEIFYNQLNHLLTSVIVNANWETTLISRQGDPFPVEITVTKNISLATKEIQFFWIVRNITDRKHAEEALQQQLTAIEAAIDGIAILRDNSYIYLNKAHLEMFGYKQPKDLVGKPWTQLYSLEEITRFEQEVFPVLGRDRCWRGEAIAIRKDGTTFTEGLSLTFTEDDLLICVCRDISDRKQAEQIIRQQSDRETLLRGITQRIRQSLDLKTIFNTACLEVRQLLQADRVGIFKFYPDSNFDDGEFVAESVVDGFTSTIEVRVHDHCFGENYAAKYAQGLVQVVPDIYNAGLTECHRDVLAQFQIQANLVIPLLCDENLWGLLCIHQCAHPRQWQESEIDLTQQIANQLTIAIQQANLYEQLQTELLVRQQAEAKIVLQLRQQQILEALTQQIRESLNINEILATVTQQVKDLLHGDRVIVFRLFPDGRSQIVEESVSEEFPKLKARTWGNEVWAQEILDCYWQGIPRIVPDVMDDLWTDCLVEYSLEGQIQSKIVAPILQDLHGLENHQWVSPTSTKKLWGILVIHSCQDRRVWQESEAQLLQQIANQLAIAIQQANLFERLQQELGERKQAQQQLTGTNQQLAISNQELARTTRHKDEFLANMSHELRTPLNAILGITEGLMDEVFGLLSEEQKRILPIIERSGNHLLELINDILDLSKIEAGKLILDCSLTDVNRLCQSSVMFVKQQAMQKNVHLTMEVAPVLPEMMIDERRIRQVLINLLNNAVKFTPEGGKITLEVTLESVDKSSADQPTHWVHFAVIDTGIGIAPDALKTLFQPFIQVDSALNRQYEGTGLGLALVKRIVDLHNGYVKAASELDRGSRFTIVLPYDSTLIPFPQASPTVYAEAIGVTNGKPDSSPLILLAEDNEANILTISSYLEAKGYRLIIAKNGMEAINLVLSEQPNLVLMDIQMPGMDGLEAIKRIRAQNLIDVPIIAVTALAMVGDREKCLAVGANDYLSKPIKLKQLATLIQQFL
jgi:PAS domain S-box-containing protein